MKTHRRPAHLEADLRVGQDLQRQIMLSQRLRAMFEEVLAEPPPADLLDLVSRIDANETKR